MANLESHPRWYEPRDPSARDANSPVLEEEQLRRVVHEFYARVRLDEEIGPVFNSVVRNWPEHLDKLTAFWSSVVLGSGRYKGNPMTAHRPHAARITADSFTRWLALWAEVTNELLPAVEASELQLRARRMAFNLGRGLALEDLTARERKVF